MAKGGKIVDMAGQTFGLLTALRFDGMHKSRAMWICRCECGVEKRIAGKFLRNGDTKSCGCAKKEHARIMGSVRHVRHGHSPDGKKSTEYVTWDSMIQRCTNKNNHAWKDYGGRGIFVCERWMIFDNFFSDMGFRPPGLQLDRRNNDGGYEPSNCRWVDRKTQQSNRRCSKRKEEAPCPTASA